MPNSLIIVSEEYMKRIFVGLGEIPSKFAHEVILDLEAQLSMADKDVKAYVALVEKHLLPHKAKIPAEVPVPPAPPLVEPVT
jgi:hypothetical protein